MVSSFWRDVVGVGLFALAHAAFSAAQHRSYMRLTEKENETLPIDIVLQTLLAFVLTIYGIVHISGEFKDMDASSELKNKTFDTLRNHPSFYMFNHRDIRYMTKNIWTPARRSHSKIMGINMD
uniref:ER membrane protein complex subunit 5-like isoform X2 n=1 Tax=Oncorhynchus gorbuscha TaxID=8017 RepID=UPI001EAF37EE|nr:ER membrane protein complex subunit 5-like isoform X2 [Oncorhynchus gorbuscha]